MSRNPFADPEYFLDYNLRGKDVKIRNRQKDKTPQEDSPPQHSTKMFSLEELADCYRATGVQYNGAIYTIDLGKELLEGGISKTITAWANYSKSAAQQNKLRVAPAPLQHALFSTLCDNQDNPQYKGLVDRIKQFLRETFEKTWVETLSKVVYEPSGKDTVIHDVGQSSQYSTRENIVGPDRWLNKTRDKNVKAACKALIGTDNLNKINDVYNWITERDTYLYRLNGIPKEREKQVVALGVSYGDRFLLNADHYIDHSRPALGVRAQKISSGNRSSK